VVESSLLVEGKLVAHLFEQLDHLLRAQIELVEMLIDRKAQRRRSRSSVAHVVLPFLFAFVRNVAIAKKLSKDRVCPLGSAAGIFDYSNFDYSNVVAFHGKRSVVRDVSVF
jgi:hypothetical protein